MMGDAMNSFDNYQKNAMQFRLPTADNVYAVLGLAEEAGEVLGKFAKMRRDGSNPDTHTQIIKELGDVLWMVAAICGDMNVNMSDVATLNLNKLYQRALKNSLKGEGDER